MKPIALSSQNGTVYAYACGVCFNTKANASSGRQINGPDPSIVEMSLSSATSCCSCRRCGAETGYIRSICKECQPIEDAENEKWKKRAEEEGARRDAAIESSFGPEGRHDRGIAEALRRFMGEISEEYYCAGWASGLEFSLWKMVLGGDRNFGADEVAPEQIKELEELSFQCGGWWRWDDGVIATLFVPVEEWKTIYAARGDRP